MSTKTIRIWEEVVIALADISDEYGYVISDLASTLLVEALRNPHILAYTLAEWFNIEWEEAKKTAEEVASRFLGFLEELEEGVEENGEAQQ